MKLDELVGADYAPKRIDRDLLSNDHSVMLSRCEASRNPWTRPFASLRVTIDGPISKFVSFFYTTLSAIHKTCRVARRYRIMKRKDKFNRVQLIGDEAYGNPNKRTANS
jgi:hypothetical protein